MKVVQLPSNKFLNTFTDGSNVGVSQQNNYHEWGNQLWL